VGPIKKKKKKKKPSGKGGGQRDREKGPLRHREATTSHAPQPRRGGSQKAHLRRVIFRTPPKKAPASAEYNGVRRNIGQKELFLNEVRRKILGKPKKKKKSLYNRQLRYREGHCRCTNRTTARNLPREKREKLGTGKSQKDEEGKKGATS